MAGRTAISQDTRTSRPLRRLGESEFRLTSKDGGDSTFRFSPDGKLLAGASWDEIRMWSFPEGRLLHDFSGIVKSTCIGFGADGREFLALYESQMEIYRFDVASGKLLRVIKLADVADEEGARRFSLSDDGRWLCMMEENGHVSVWNAVDGKRQFRKEIFHAYECHVSKNDVLTLWSDIFLDRYNVKSGEQLSRRKRSRGILASNAQGTLVAGYSADDKGIVFWNPETDARVGGIVPVSDPKELRDAALSADGRRFIFWINKDKSTWEKKIAVFDVATGAMVSSFDPPGTWSVEQPIVSPDGRYTFPATGRFVFCPIDTNMGKPFRTTADHVLPVETLSFTPDSKTLLVGSRDRRQAWDVDSGQPRTMFEARNYTPLIAVVDNERVLVSGLRHGGLRLQKIATGAVEHDYGKDSSTPLSALELATDRKSFVVLVPEPKGHVVRRWDIATGDMVAERTMPPRGRPDVVSAAGLIRGLAIGGSRLVRLEQVVPAKKLPDGSIDWGRIELSLEDWTTQRITNQLPVPALGRFSFADTADGTALAAVVTDAHMPSYGEKWGASYLLVWDTATGWERIRVKREMDNFFGAFARVAITPDWRLAATATMGGRIEIWNGFSGYQVESFETRSAVTSLAFSDDGLVLASGHQDGTVNLWSTRMAWNQAVFRRHFTAKGAQQYWDDLGRAERKPALALQTLLGDPNPAAEMLKRNLRPATPAKDVTAPVAAPMSPDTRRSILGILLAEKIDTVESRRILEQMAGGAADAPETVVAKEALLRLSGKKPMETVKASD
jgi:WD40 repeat protein